MSIDIYAADGLPQSELNKAAMFVSDFTVGPAGLEAKLLPLSPGDVVSRVGFIACDGSDFRGYAGVSPPIPGESKIELGPFIVPPVYRKQGIGAKLVAAAVTFALEQGYTPYVFGNPANLGNLKRAGFAESCAEDFPVFSYELCATTCPFFTSADVCCNTPVILAEGTQVVGQSVAEWPVGQVLRMPGEM